MQRVKSSSDRQLCLNTMLEADLDDRQRQVDFDAVRIGRSGRRDGVDFPHGQCADLVALLSVAAQSNKHAPRRPTSAIRL